MGGLFVFSPQRPASTGRWSSPRACLCQHRPARGEGHVPLKRHCMGRVTGGKCAQTTDVAWPLSPDSLGYGVTLHLPSAPPGVTGRWASPSGSAAKLCVSGPPPRQGQALTALSSLSVRGCSTGRSAHDMAIPGNSSSPAFCRQWPLRQGPMQGGRLRATTRRRGHISDTSLHAGFVAPFLKALVFPLTFYLFSYFFNILFLFLI